MPDPTPPTLAVYLVSLVFQGPDTKSVHIVNAVVAEAPEKAAAFLTTHYLQSSGCDWPFASCAVAMLNEEFITNALSAIRGHNGGSGGQIVALHAVEPPKDVAE